MIPHTISDASIVFVARGQVWSLAADHAWFGDIRQLLTSGSTDEDKLVRLADVQTAVSDSTNGRGQLTDDALTIDGEVMPEQWHQKAMEAPETVKVLLVRPGDRVRVEGDEDAPDGIYTVGEVDNSDTSKRVYVESEDDFFGFIINSSIKEIIMQP